MYDIIGDVHGYAQLLKKMLLELGYTKDGTGFSHPDRKAVFVGDFINRGPISGKPFALSGQWLKIKMPWPYLGNHEINIIIDTSKTKKTYLCITI
jgi:hypothetical protein